MHPELTKWILRRVVTLTVMLMSGTLLALASVVLGDLKRMQCLPQWASGIPWNLIGLVLLLLVILACSLVERFWNAPLYEELRKQGLVPRKTSGRGRMIKFAGGVLLAVAFFGLLTSLLPLTPLRTDLEMTKGMYSERLQPFLWLALASVVVSVAVVLGDYLISRRWQGE